MGHHQMTGDAPYPLAAPTDAPDFTVYRVDACRAQIASALGIHCSDIAVKRGKAAHEIDHGKFRYRIEYLTRGKVGIVGKPILFDSAEIKSQQKEMYAVAKERSLSPRRCIVYRVDETIPWDFWEKNRAERKIKEGEMISVSFARTWSTTAHAGRLPGRRRTLAHRSVVVAAPLRAPA